MNKKFFAVGVLASAAALVAGSTMPASAADTTTTFALSGGALSVTVASSANLGTVVTGTASVSGTLGDVSVNDQRGGTTAWSVDGSTSRFVNGVVRADNGSVTYNTGLIMSTGTSVIANSGNQSLTAVPSKVAGPTSVVGNNTAQWNPTLTVGLRSDTTVGTYTGTITTSVS